MFVYTPFVWPLIIATILCVVIAWYVQRYPETPASRPFIIMMLVGAAWTFLYGFSIITVWYPLRLLLSIVMYVPSRLMAPAILYFALEYSGKEHWITRRTIALVLIIPIISILASFTSPWHQLFRYNFYLDTSSSSIPILHYSSGPLFTLSNIFNAIVIFTSLFLMLLSLRDRALKPASTLILIAGIFIPIVVEILFTNDITPIRGYNFAASTIVFTGAAYLFALLKYQLFGFVPIARSTVLEHITDLVVVIDIQRQLVDCNPPAIEALGLNPVHYVGIPLDHLIDPWKSVIYEELEKGPGQRERRIDTSQEKDSCIYDVTVRIIKDRRNRVLGTLFLFHDVTALRASEEQVRCLLEEKELLLREVHHRIKNNLSVISSILSLQSESLVSNEHAKTALLEARSRVQSMALLYNNQYSSIGNGSLPLNEYLEPLIDRLFSMYPVAPYVQLYKNIAPILLNGKILFALGLMVNELLTNALKYAYDPGEHGVIKISTQQMDNHLEISVIDFGNKFTTVSEEQKRRGLGLQLVELMARQIGARFELHTDGKTAAYIVVPLDDKA
ncbi:MAG: histidine kinase N-terminal 7TM domain-containing protein [Termitinemataceae bacterium]